MSPAFKIFNFEENFMLGNLDQFSFKVPLAHSPPPMGLCTAKTPVLNSTPPVL